ncbi:MAG TPA: redox-sensing transcriptional repressor Rex [Gemmatimonadaceae bacterium]|nr:redox-sensing transcriptional repressor Rex [Gemmatimonadaceae bacterium]
MNSQAPMPLKRIADSTVRRLSLYLRFLEEFENAGLTTVSSDELAARGGTTSAQVRKDLSFFGSFGKRGLGYQVAELTQSMRRILGLERDWRVIIVGIGKIGSALAQYEGFQQRGFRVVGLYDSDPAKIGREVYNLPVLPIEAIAEDNRERPVDIAVIAVPASAAQRVVDQVVAAGITGIMSFAPIQLHVPADVTLNTVNMAMELERLSFALSNRE